MRRLADYTVGLVIVLVHLVMMGRANEKLPLLPTSSKRTP
jgi:hypothetical protein